MFAPARRDGDSKHRPARRRPAPFGCYSRCAGSRSQTVANLRPRYHPSEGTPIQPVFTQEKANDLIREFNRLTQQVTHMEKRLDKYSSVLRAVFELMRAELNLEPAALVEKLAAVVREKAERAQAPCAGCNRPLGDKKKCIYCGEERKTESIFDLL
jgi:hypothetical protein